MTMFIDSEGRVDFDVPVTRKLKLVLPPLEGPPAPAWEAPRACVICEAVKQPHEFVSTNSMKGERGRLCWSCQRIYYRRGPHGLPWQAGVAWPDQVAFDEAKMTLRALEMEIDHARRA